MDAEQRSRMARGAGFVAALDQSGGSTPQALRLYGVPDSDYADDDEMFDLMYQFLQQDHHPFRVHRRPGGGRHPVRTDDAAPDRRRAHRRFPGRRTNVVRFVKVDEGLAAQSRGVRLMKPSPA